MLTKEDKMISSFLKAIGPWSQYIIIGGGFAPIIYKLYLSRQEDGPFPVRTQDLDSLIHRRVPENKKPVLDYLLEAGFEINFKNLDNPALESYVKEIDGYELEIEFITSDDIRGDKKQNQKIAGIVAQPLKYLKLSLFDGLDFQTFSGEKGLVVEPGKWIFHKGLSFVYRKQESKKLKDLYGIWYVGTQLGDFSNKAINVLSEFRENESSWFNKFRKNITYWIQNASPVKWSELEMQDPYGNLKKAGFLYLIDEVFSGA